jgi:hypothetical protein
MGVQTWPFRSHPFEAQHLPFWYVWPRGQQLPLEKHWWEGQGWLSWLPH